MSINRNEIFKKMPKTPKMNCTPHDIRGGSRFFSVRATRPHMGGGATEMFERVGKARRSSNKNPLVMIFHMKVMWVIMRL